jgi:hypothetical protein
MHQMTSVHVLPLHIIVNRLSVYLSICLSNYLFICLSVDDVSICLSVYLTSFLSVYLSIFLSVYLTENVLSAIENGYVRFTNGTIRAVDDDARKRRYFVFTFVPSKSNLLCINQYSVKYNVECF